MIRWIRISALCYSDLVFTFYCNNLPIVQGVHGHTISLFFLFWIDGCLSLVLDIS